MYYLNEVRSKICKILKLKVLIRLACYFVFIFEIFLHFFVKNITEKDGGVLQAYALETCLFI